MNTNKNCSTCMFYSSEDRTCTNKDFNSIKYNITTGTDDFMDYCSKEQDKVYVGKMFLCELHQS